MTIPNLNHRLAELKREYELGESRLRELASQELVLRETLLRISGAIQVLEELAAGDGSASPEDQPKAENGHAKGADAGSGSGAAPEILTVP